MNASTMLGLAFASLVPLPVESFWGPAGDPAGSEERDEPMHRLVTVSVEAPEADARFRGVVVQRLLEGGRALAPPGVAPTVQLHLRSLRHSVLIEAVAGRQRRSLEIDHGEPEPTKLEVAHAAVDLVQRFEAEAEPSSADPLVRASVQFIGFSPAGDHYAVVTQALLEAGFLVVGPDRDAEWIMCVWQVQEGYAIERALPEGCAATPAGPARVSLARGASDLALATAETITSQLAQSVEEALQDPAEPLAPQHSQAPSVTISAVPQPQRRPRASWLELRLDGGAQFRRSAFDGAADLSISGGRGRFGGTLRLEWIPSVGEVTILDTTITAGPAVGWNAGKRVQMSLHALGGVLIHRARWGDDIGLRGDFTVSVPLFFDILVGRGWAIYLGLSGGFASRSRTHRTTDGEDLWSRGAFRLGGFAGVRYRMTWKGAPS